jgi:hypothetical protein
MPCDIPECHGGPYCTPDDHDGPNPDCTECTHCHGARLVGWSAAGPTLCPKCSSGKDAFTFVTKAWREQRYRANALQSELSDARASEKHFAGSIANASNRDLASAWDRAEFHASACDSPEQREIWKAFSRAVEIECRRRRKEKSGP